MLSFISVMTRRQMAVHFSAFNSIKNTSNCFWSQFSKKPLMDEMMRRFSVSSHNRTSDGPTTTTAPVENRWWETPVRELASRQQWEEQRLLYAFHEAGGKWRRPRKHPLDNKPQMKGIVLKTLIKKPKKPNSANRKCVLLRLTNGKEKVAFVPGVGHNLQEHSIVLVQKKRVRDVPGLKLRVIRGVYDCARVVKKTAQ